jgi:hypothetical protein
LGSCCACADNAKPATSEISGTAIFKRLKARIVFFSTATTTAIMDQPDLEIHFARRV